MVRALVTNDDGIDSPGLRYLVEELSARGFEVYLVAPRTQVSGAGKSNSHTVKVWPVTYQGTRAAWAMDGRPADAVAIGLKALLGFRPDVVVSGINIGPNMGITDFFTSGTVGAAIESALLGVRAIASSYSVLRGLADWDHPHLRNAAMLTAEIVERFSKDRGAGGNVDLVILNFPRGEPRGLRLAHMAMISNIEIYDGEEEGVYHVLGWKTDNLDEAYSGGEEGTDVDVVKRGYASVTPVCLRCMASTTSDRSAMAYLNRLLEGLLS